MQVFAVIDRQPAIVADVGASPSGCEGCIELRDVTFCYPSRPDFPVFHDFSLTIPAGHMVALVGESGSGKSTIVSLIERFYDPQRLVSQEPVLFGDTIRNNIMYGKEGATAREVIAAAKVANAHRFIARLPAGYDTPVGERGMQLSGGQKQRIAIARAILKDPRILLLDEATSALDSESERLVQEALDKLMVGRTTLAIAHRLSTIRNADVIVVVKKGRVVEMGTHEELMAAEPEAPPPTRRGLAAEPGSRVAEEGPRKAEDGSRAAEERSTGDADGPRGGEEGSREDTTREGCEGTERGLYRRLVEMQAMLSSESPRADDQDLGTWEEATSMSGRVGKDGGQRSALRGMLDQAWSKLGLKADRSEGERGRSGQEAAGDPLEGKQVPLARIYSGSRGDWPYAVAGGISAVVVGLINPGRAFFISELTAAVFLPERERTAEIRQWAFVFLGLAAGCSLGYLALGYSLGVVDARLVHRLRLGLVRALLRQDVAFFDEEANASGAVMGRLENDTQAVRAVAGDRLGIILTNLVCVGVGLTVAVVVGWRLALVTIAIFPILLTTNTVLETWLAGGAGGLSAMMGRANQVMSECVGNIRTIAAFTAEDRVLTNYQCALDAPYRMGKRRMQLAGASYGASNFVFFASYALCFWYGSKLIARGEMAFEDVLKAFFLIMYSAMAVGQNQARAGDLEKARDAANGIFALLDAAPRIPLDDPGALHKEKLEGTVELRHVRFAYPRRPTQLVLQDLSLAVPAGRTLALVGRSGCGKSTVLALIERFYDVRDGAVLVDGVDVRRYNLRWLRQQIGLVSQEPVLFSGSIRSNIMYGKEDASEEEVNTAAKAANAHGFITQLPEGYDTPVGERGTQLSGGQKQRIAIARAILKDPRILLLDEATSALDSESERLVQEALDKLMVGRTTLAIAHRLSTIRNADIIALINKGRVVECGTHRELLRKGGEYAELAKDRGDPQGDGSTNIRIAVQRTDVAVDAWTLASSGAQAATSGAQTSSDSAQTLPTSAHLLLLNSRDQMSPNYRARVATNSAHSPVDGAHAAMIDEGLHLHVLYDDGSHARAASVGMIDL
eukprot:jgi/Mesvir1/22888/Mv19411-RA.1